MPLCNTLLLALVLALFLDLSIQVVFLGVFTVCPYPGSRRTGGLVQCWHNGRDLGPDMW